MNKHRLLIRILVAPIILQLLIVNYTYHLIKHFIAYIRWGGEWLTYSKDTRKTVDDIYKLLENELIKNKYNGRKGQIHS